MNWVYLPILKWKQGERIALSKLTREQRRNVLPVIELPAMKSTHELAALREAMPDYIEKLVKEMGRTFSEEQVVGIDTHWVATGHANQIRLLAAVCRRIAARVKFRIVPVVRDRALMDNPADLERLAAYHAVILRIQTPVAQADDVIPLLKLVTDSGTKRRNVHVVIDQYAIVQEDPGQRLIAVSPYLETALAAQCGSVTVAGGSFPVNLMAYKKQGVFDIPRVEWRIWQLLQRRSQFTALRFGDYTVSNPGPLPAGDPQQMNPSVAIRYALEDQWKLYKAGGFKNGAPNQYKNLCNLLISDPGVYSGEDFSDGDERYAKAAAGTIGNGTPSSWRPDATSHHIVLTRAALLG